MKSRNLILFFSLSLMLSGCNLGFMTVQYGEGEEPEGSTTSPNQTPTPVSSQNPQTGEPIDSGPEAVLNYASFGERCVDGQVIRYLVLSDAPTDCVAHAEAIDSVTTTGSAVKTAVFDLETTSRSPSFSYCESQGNCREVQLTMDVDDTGAAVSGSWTGSPTLEEQTVQFSASACDYDTAVAPLPSETLARDISITEVSVYQGVKIPIVEDGVEVTNRNAPIIANRPGIVRVFLEPGAAWQQRELVARLTIGDTVREERITPEAVSTEMQSASTVNYQFESGELPTGADVSVELLEAQSCSNGGATEERPRVPESGAFPLQAREIGTMKIMLVPIQYQADGSNRVPDLGQAAADRYREAALSHFPVEDIELTVADPVATGIGLSPNGQGFGEMLNFCLNVRNQQNADPEVYYYCVIQPAESRQSFCGSGCVGGVAPVPGANNTQARAGIGIGFNGGGEDVFVHEIGHTLGRPHSPCGGAAGTDPNYPYSQGAIGSWGYDILTGQLFQPDARADFMGYCNPSWVSDYTYSRLFDRLQQVLMTQSFRSLQSEKNWRTAVIQDGTISWGDDRRLRSTPSGSELLANLRGIDGGVMAEPRVFVTPIADIDAVLLTVEDTGVSGDMIEVPGIGQFPIR